jgi:hypothetical protein
LCGGDLTVEGNISSDGGDGGAGGLGGNGGGGSGGSILLQSYGDMTIGSGAEISAVGGRGAGGSAESRGGDGGNGRVRWEATGAVFIQGTVRPGTARKKVHTAPGSTAAILRKGE